MVWHFWPVEKVAELVDGPTVWGEVVGGGGGGIFYWTLSVKVSFA
jgi:hypothetical protein